jgi:hypothetical protein
MPAVDSASRENAMDAQSLTYKGFSYQENSDMAMDIEETGEIGMQIESETKENF